MKVQLRENYEKDGMDYRNLWDSHSYLTNLVLNSALEIDFHRLRENNDFTSVAEFSEYLGQVFERHHELILFNSLRKASEKVKPPYGEDQMRLDLKLLSNELKNIDNLSKERRGMLMHLLLDINREFSRKLVDDYRVCRLTG